MIEILALSAAAMWGAADFMAGLAAKRVNAFTTTFLEQAVGLFVIGALIPFAGGSPIGRDLAWGAVAGMGAAYAVVLLYRGLAQGQMNVVAPVTAVTAAVVPVLAGFAFGERPSALALTGVGVAIVAIALLGMQEHPPSDRADAPTGRVLRGKGLAGALAAGLGFAVYYILMSRTSDASGLWPLLSERVVTCTMLVVLPVTVRGMRAGLPPPSKSLILASGSIEMVANVAYLVAVRGGTLALVAVLASLYPAATVVLARVVLRERFGRLHAAGLALALVAVALIAAGR